MENLSYLFSAYCVIWVVIFSYLFILHRRLKSLQAELDELKQQEQSHSCTCNKDK